LQVDWQPNTIALHWYNGDTELTVPSASQSCTYDGTLTPPATIPTKTGYTFKGWRVKQGNSGGQQAQQCTFASSVCGLSSSQVSSLVGTNSGWISHDGQYTAGESQYGLISAGDWALQFNNGDVVRGIASCNDVSGSEQWETCNTDAFKPSNTFNTSSTGQYCWCKMISYTPSGGSDCSVVSSAWVFEYDNGNESDCANECASYCAFDLWTYDITFRQAVFTAQYQ
ncbi:MAG: InlB B-repeat-containing protein, partial [Alphaproteobacteria bacterium]|nr:InlB B-repeat-containing protein [Alphaproteobacteria bacterium]